jgi:pimeloyl-ACP methyl ester carboxylesterase
MLPGIEGRAWMLSAAHRAFRDAGVDAEIRVFHWARPPLDPLKNLTDYDGNLQRAGEIANEIAVYRRKHPGASIDVVGYSGGGGLAVMVAEALPEDVRLRNLLLAQPALSPDYDLTSALSRIDGKLVNFYSPHDWLILGVGTQLFGTIDRKEVASAGKERFDLERAVSDPALRQKVEQRGWNVRMIGSGHFGNHHSILSHGWNKRYVAPHLLPERGAAGREKGKSSFMHK